MANDNMQVREQKIRDERANVYTTMTGVMEKMDKGETLTVEDRTAFDQAEARMEELEGDLDRVLKMRKREDTRDEAAETRSVSRDENDSEESAYTRAFRNWFIRGEKDMDNQDERKLIRSAAHIPADMEKRATADPSGGMQTAPGQGGYMIPQGFWHNLQQAMKAYGGLLPHTNIQKTATGNELPWPTNNSTGVVGSYITEANQVGFTDFAFGQGILYAWTITSGVILASFQLLNDSAFDVDSFVTERMGEAIGRKVAQELWTGAGSGAKAMTGLMPAVAANGGAGSGAAGSGYVTAPNGAHVFTLSNPVSPGLAEYQSGIASWADLTAMIAGVDPAYRNSGANCAFYMNDTQVQLERTLTDGFGHPLWEPNTQAGQPDTILGYPVIIDNNSPSVSTSSTATVGGIVFGDMKRAMVVRQVDMAGTMRLTERYADFLSVGFLGYTRMDSQPNDLRAISVFKSAAS